MLTSKDITAKNAITAKDDRSANGFDLMEVEGRPTAAPSYLLLMPRAVMLKVMDRIRDLIASGVSLADAADVVKSELPPREAHRICRIETGAAFGPTPPAPSPRPPTPARADR